MTYKQSNTSVIINTTAELFANAIDSVNTTSVISVQDNSFQGTIAGFVWGGIGNTYNLDRFSFANDTSIASSSPSFNLMPTGGYAGTYAGSNHSSKVHGYTSGGATAVRYEIQKFSFSNQTQFYYVGNLSEGVYTNSGTSSSTHGFSSGGRSYPGGTNLNRIDRFPFASDVNSTQVGYLSTPVSYTGAGISSSTHGYICGGINPPTVVNTIQKFPLASGGVTTDIGDLATRGYYIGGGISSTTNGFRVGGGYSPIYSNVIEKFPFATDSNATDAGDLTAGKNNTSGISSYNSGYVAGGTSPSSSHLNTIEKFPFAAATVSTDIADMSVNRSRATGHQF